MGRAIPVFPCAKVLKWQRASASEDTSYARGFPLSISLVAQLAACTVSQPRLKQKEKRKPSGDFLCRSGAKSRREAKREKPDFSATHSRSGGAGPALHAGDGAALPSPLAPIVRVFFYSFFFASGHACGLEGPLHYTAQQAAAVHSNQGHEAAQRLLTRIVSRRSARLLYPLLFSRAHTITQ